MKVKEKFMSWIRSPRFEGEEQITSGIGLDGREYPDPVPFAPDAGLHPPESQADLIMRLMRDARLREAAELEGFDSEEEADDFDIEDDPVDPTTPWEEPYLPPKRPPPSPPVAKDASNAPAPSSPAAPAPQATPEASEAPSKPDAS